MNVSNFFNLLFILIVLGLIVYAIFFLYHRLFLNYQERVDLKVLLIEKQTPEGQVITVPGEFGSKKMFESVELDQTDPKKKTFNMVIKPIFQSLSFNLISLNSKNEVVSNQQYRIHTNQTTYRFSVPIPKDAVAVVPVYNQSNNEPYLERNLYSLRHTDVFVYAVFQAISIGMAMNLIVRGIANFYAIIPTTCPLCRLSWTQNLLYFGWIIGILTFFIMYPITKRVYAKYLSGGLAL
jgi:hypothetical protein